MKIDASNPSAQLHDFRAFGLSNGAVAALLTIPMHSRPQSYASLTGDNGDGCPVRCAAPGCGAIIPLALAHGGRIEHNYSAAIAGIGRCQHELADSGQHFACSLDHLREALMECWDHHTMPKVRAAYTGDAAPAPTEPTDHDTGRFPALDDASSPPVSPMIHKF